jgi:hypothetical protein
MKRACSSWNHSIYSHDCLSMLSQSSLLRSLIAAVLLILSCAAFDTVRGQDEEPAVVEAPTPGAVLKAPTEIFLLKDKNGKFVKVATNLMLEEYLRMYNQQNQIDTPNTPPPFTIEETTFSGRATQTHALLTVAYRIRIVRDVSGQWTRVPLRLSQSVMRTAPDYAGTGSFFVTWDEQEGHVGWIRGAADSVHTLTLDIIRPLRKAGQITQLQLDTPRARGRFTSLVVPLPKAQFSPPEIAVQTKSAPGNATEFAFDFQGGDLQISWSANDQINSPVTTRYQATVATRYNVLGRKNMSAEVDISIDGLGADVTSFEVLLPPSMQWVNTPTGEYRITVSGSQVSPTGDPLGARQRLLVVMNKPVAQTTIELQAIYQPTASAVNSDSAVGPVFGDANESMVTFTGFEVLDTVKQSGSVLISSDVNWALWWHISGDVRRKNPADQETPLDTGSRSNVAFFEYYNLSYTVVGTIRPQVTQLQISPQYYFKVATTEVRLEIELHCQYVGNGEYDLSIEHPDWEFDQVFQRQGESSTLVDFQATAGKVDFSVSTLGDDAVGELVVVIRARRLTESAIQQQDIPITLMTAKIKAMGGASAAVKRSLATVAVQAADNVEMTPQLAKMKGLVIGTRQDLDAFENIDSGQTPLIYRATPEHEAQDSLEFRGSMRIRQRSMLVSSRSVISLDEQFASFQQTLDYQVDYEGLRQIVLQVPEIVRTNKTLRVFTETSVVNSEEQTIVSQKALPWSVITNPAGVGGDNGEPQEPVVAVDLQSDLRGQIRIVLHFQQELPQLLSDESQTVNFQLIMPVQQATTQVVRNSVTVETQDVFHCQRVGKDWQLDRESQSGSAADLLNIFSTVETAKVPIAMRLRRDATLNATELQRYWAQTIFTDKGSRERIAMLIRTNDVFVRLQLPEDISFDDDSLVVAINGQRVPLDQVVPNRDRQLIVRLSSQRVEAEYRIEAWYTRTAVDSHRFLVTLPEIVGVRNSGRVYWQVVMPGDRHLFKSPAAMTAEYEWKWTGLWWSRFAALDQQSLEQWIGVEQQRMTTGSVNQYVFSSVGAVPSFEVTSFQRWTLLLIVSAIVLVVGMVVMFVGWLHHPATLMVLGGVLTTAAVWIPELVLLIIQASLGGFVLIGLAKLLHVLLRTPNLLPPVRHAGAIQTVETHSAVLSLLEIPQSAMDPSSQASHGPTELDQEASDAIPASQSRSSEKQA